MPSPLNITRFYILFEQTINIIESWLNLFITALFTNMRILKFKSQLTIAFFTAVNHLNEPLRKQNFTLTGSKGHGWWFVIGGFRSVLCVSVSFKGRNYDWRQRKTQLWRRLLNSFLRILEMQFHRKKKETKKPQELVWKFVQKHMKTHGTKVPWPAMKDDKCCFFKIAKPFANRVTHR